MNSPRPARSSTLAHGMITVLAVLHLTGCTTTELRPRVVAPYPDSVVLADLDPPVTLHHPRVVGETLVGWQRVQSGDSIEVRVPAEVETETASVGGPLLLVVTAVGVALAIAVSRMEFGGGWGGGE